jgi:hypothetical protein
MIRNLPPLHQNCSRSRYVVIFLKNFNNIRIYFKDVSPYKILGIMFDGANVAPTSQIRMTTKFVWG